jgi:hypothetical protein
MTWTCEQITNPRGGARVYRVTWHGETATILGGHTVAPGEARDLPSVTTVNKVMPAPALERWKLGQVAAGIAHNEDLRRLAASGEDEAKDAAYQALDRQKQKANIGTATHKLSEKVTTAADAFEVAAEFRPTMERFGQMLDDHAIVVKQTELVLVNLTVGYAGTADRLVTHPDLGRAVADLKTGKVAYFEQAMQLAALANAEYAFVAGHGLVPMPAINSERGLVLHLPEDGDTADVWALDLVDAWAAFQAACTIKHLTSRDENKGSVGEKLTATHRFDDLTRTWLRDRLVHLQSQHPSAFAELRTAWVGSGLPTLKDEPEMTGDTLEAVCTLLYRFEAQHQLPFPDDYPHPHGPRIGPHAAEEIVARIDALPAWARGQVNDERSKLPALAMWRVTDAEEFDQVLVGAESAAASLADSVTALSTDVPDLAWSLIADHFAPTSVGEWGWTEFEVASRLVEAMAAGFITATEDGWKILPTIVDRLADLHGSKADATKAIRARVAELGLDLTVPRGIADCCTDPVLVALAA